jgi:hypothetical protein
MEMRIGRGMKGSAAIVVELTTKILRTYLKAKHDISVRLERLVRVVEAINVLKWKDL